MLTWSSDIVDASASISCHAERPCGRVQWIWKIRVGPHEWSGEDLETHGYRPTEALVSLAHFLAAWDEARGTDGENADLFPELLGHMIDLRGAAFIDEMNMDLASIDE